MLVNMQDKTNAFRCIREGERETEGAETNKHLVYWWRIKSCKWNHKVENKHYVFKFEHYFDVFQLNFGFSKVDDVGQLIPTVSQVMV